jgi:hypothetical protein
MITASPSSEKLQKKKETLKIFSLEVMKTSPDDGLLQAETCRLINL